MQELIPLAKAVSEHCLLNIDCASASFLFSLAHFFSMCRLYKRLKCVASHLLSSLFLVMMLCFNLCQIKLEEGSYHCSLMYICQSLVSVALNV